MSVIELVREFRAGGGFYDDDAVAFVAERLGCEPSRELSRACYQAKGQLRDAEAQQKLDALLADGFAPAADAILVPGKRYAVCRGVTYVGRSVADYGGAVSCRAIAGERGLVALLPGRNRTNGFYANPTDLVREEA